MYISILGRQSDISLAELDALFSDVTRTSPDVATFNSSSRPDIQRLGGSLKLGADFFTCDSRAWPKIEAALIRHALERWSGVDHKLTLGISVYDLPITIKQLDRSALKLKQALKARGVSVRLLPIKSLQLSTATSHHNKLGLSDNKVELLIAPTRQGVQVATSIGAQNITALAARDQGRPRRDAFVGMLPPKLAQIMINLAAGDTLHQGMTLLDPFCGTGVVLQEALLDGFNAYGTDLSEKMVEYSRENLEWLTKTHHITPSFRVDHGDAMTYRWQPPIDIVVCETYLGQPFSAPPSPAKLRDVTATCNHIITTFLQNIARQIAPGTTLCIAVPAWRDTKGGFTHLPLTRQLDSLGFSQTKLSRRSRLLYFREDQVVARELIVLTKSA